MFSSAPLAGQYIEVVPVQDQAQGGGFKMFCSAPAAGQYIEVVAVQAQAQAGGGFFGQGQIFWLEVVAVQAQVQGGARFVGQPATQTIEVASVSNTRGKRGLTSRQNEIEVVTDRHAPPPTGRSEIVNRSSIADS